MPYMPQLDEPAEVIGAPAGPPGGALNYLQRRFLRAGRMLVAGGFVVVTHATVGGQAAANAAHALVGFALLLLGVSLIMLSPVATKFRPGAAQVGAAIADAALLYLFPPAGN
ncbi:hypothetical protein GQ55_4G049400 [Panicum hallii var. hallii]|uniref:Uncharacterized protein n=1 Tax=Panicum hallii var. hallii TaxID=1504633 RepID=A0A2T7DVB8_9POAL|nr:hypothetical protein GQ55_4G049400 [Panicum hallii var. hallii]